MPSQKPPLPSQTLLMIGGHHAATWPALGTGEMRRQVLLLDSLPGRDRQGEGVGINVERAELPTGELYGGDGWGPSIRGLVSRAGRFLSVKFSNPLPEFRHLAEAGNQGSQEILLSVKPLTSARCPLPESYGWSQMGEDQSLAGRGRERHLWVLLASV